MLDDDRMDLGKKDSSVPQQSSSLDQATIQADIMKLWGQETDWLPPKPVEGDTNNATQSMDGLGQSTGNQHTLVLLDCGPAMMMTTPDDCSCFRIALEACERVVRQHVQNVATKKTSGNRDAFGIMLYNTRLRFPVKHSHPEDTPKMDQQQQVGATSTSTRHGVLEDEDDEEEEYEDVPYKVLESTIHDFIPLAPPGVSTIKFIQRALGRCPDAPPLDLVALYGHNNTDDADNSNNIISSTIQYDLNAAIFTAGDALNQIRKKNTDHAQIWVLTNHPIPCTSESQRVLENTIQDKLLQGTSIVFWPMSSDPLTHYEHLGGKVQPCIETLDQLVDQLQQSWKKIRPLWQLPLIRFDWQEYCRDEAGTERPPAGILLDFYDLVARGTRPSELEFHTYSGVPIVRETHYLAEHGGPILRIKVGRGSSAGNVVYSIPIERFDTSYALLHKDIPVKMNHDDRIQIQQRANACPYKSLILLGFKPVDEVPFLSWVDKPYFVCPSVSEENSNGVGAFAHLRDSMIRKNVVAIGELLPRNTGTSRLVALYPSIPDDDTSFQQPPRGLIATMLPFQEEIRLLNEDTEFSDGPELVSDNLRDRTKELVQKLTYKKQQQPSVDEDDNNQSDIGEDDDEQSAIDEDDGLPAIGKHFANADLDMLYQYIERVALNESQSVEDDTVEYDTIIPEERQEQLRIKYQSLVEAIRGALPQLPVAAPRPPPPPAAAAAAIDAVSSVEALLVEYGADVTKWKVPMLKNYCKLCGLRQVGKKADLIERVELHLNLVMSLEE